MNIIENQISNLGNGLRNCLRLYQERIKRESIKENLGGMEDRAERVR